MIQESEVSLDNTNFLNPHNSLRKIKDYKFDDEKTEIERIKEEVENEYT